MPWCSGRRCWLVGLWASRHAARTPHRSSTPRPAHPVLREGQATTWVATVEPGPGIEEVGLALLPTDLHRATRRRSRSVSAARAVDHPAHPRHRLPEHCAGAAGPWDRRPWRSAVRSVRSAWEPEPVIAARHPHRPAARHLRARGSRCPGRTGWSGRTGRTTRATVASSTRSGRSGSATGCAGCTGRCRSAPASCTSPRPTPTRTARSCCSSTPCTTSVSSEGIDGVEQQPRQRRPGRRGHRRALPAHRRPGRAAGARRA